MRKIMHGAAALAIATAAAAVVGTGTAHASDHPAYECPAGAVCIYPQNVDYKVSIPTTVYYSYGAHNLSNQFGMHYVMNNQYGGNANAHLCTSYNGVNCPYTLAQNDVRLYDLTPINSITLDRP